jgi:hypothetical protein
MLLREFTVAFVNALCRANKQLKLQVILYDIIPKLYRMQSIGKPLLLFSTVCCYKPQLACLGDYFLEVVHL